jgi:hypothetical protein
LTASLLQASPAWSWTSLTNPRRMHAFTRSAVSLPQALLASLAAMINPRRGTVLRWRAAVLGPDHAAKAPEEETTVSSAEPPEPAVLSRRASVNDRDALEALIASLPASVAPYARGMTKVADESSGRMRYVELLRSAYGLWYRRVDNVFICTTFRNIKSLDQADELWHEIEKLSTPDTPIMRCLHAKVTGLSIDPEAP